MLCDIAQVEVGSRYVDYVHKHDADIQGIHSSSKLSPGELS